MACGFGVKKNLEV